MLIIYLARQLLGGSSGVKRRRRGNADSLLLAADRVYLSRMLPCATTVSYTARFTFTHRGEKYRFCGTFPRVTPGRR